MSTRDIEMQQTIMAAQLEQEQVARGVAGKSAVRVMLSDRSAIDPVTYAVLTAANDDDGRERMQVLVGMTEFQIALNRYRDGTFILFKPVPEWVVDDGVRSMEKPEQTLEVFRGVLKVLEIPFVELGEEMKDLQARVAFARRLLSQVVGTRLFLLENRIKTLISFFPGRGEAVKARGMKPRLEHGLVAVIVDRTSYQPRPQKTHAGGKERAREIHFLSTFLCNHDCRCLRIDDDRMNFALRRRLLLPSRWVLTSRYPRPLGRPLSFSVKARDTSSKSAPESTRVASSSFPPLPDTLPEPPAYPCPHLANFDALKPLYQRHWKICTSYNHARDAKTVALEKKFVLTKYRHTLEFFNDVMGLHGTCAQEKVGPFRIMGGSGTNMTMCLASSNRSPLYVHDIDVHLEDVKCCSAPVSVRCAAFRRDNIEGHTPGYPH